MAKKQVPQSRRKKPVPQRTEATSDADNAMRALVELFSDPKLKSKAHFRYPVDGRRSEAEQAVDAAIEAAFGPDKKREHWVRRLRRLGLVNDRNGGTPAKRPRPRGGS